MSGPRGGRPHEEVEVGVDHGEPHVDRRFGDLAVRVGLTELVARQRGSAPPAIRHDLEALVDEVAVPHLAEQPPDAFDVVVRERPVRVGGVDPHADAGRERGPVLDVALYGLAAPLVEGLDPVVDDLVLVRDPERLLDLDLDREAVTVPPTLAGDVPAAHGVEARVEVFERTRPYVVNAGSGVGGRRALVEHPLGCVFATTEALAKRVLSTPAFENARFESDEVEGRRHRLERHVP